MKRPILMGYILLILATACRPPISVRQQPEIANVSGETEIRGNETFIWIRIASNEGDSSWNVEFINDSPEELTVEKVVSTTNIRWKVNPERSRVLTQYRISPITISKVAPYQLKLTSHDGQTTSLTVRFISDGQGIGIGTMLLGKFN